MTKQEAILAMKAGKKVEHKSYKASFWLDGHTMLGSDGTRMSLIDFYHDGAPDGWLIFEESGPAVQWETTKGLSNEEIDSFAEAATNPWPENDCRKDDHAHDCSCGAVEVGIIYGMKAVRAELLSLKGENVTLNSMVSKKIIETNQLRSREAALTEALNWCVEQLTPFENMEAIGPLESMKLREIRALLSPDNKTEKP